MPFWINSENFEYFFEKIVLLKNLDSHPQDQTYEVTLIGPGSIFITALRADRS